jgi:putative flippase GtrA
MGARVVRRFFGLSLVQKVLSPARGDRAIHKFIRYSMVSGVAIVISQTAILICTALFHTSGILANTVGAVVATPASYELNRKWAWGKHGKSHMWKEVAPFWALTLLGFLGSTGTVELADNLCRSHHVIGLTRSLAIMGASLLAYGIVWVAKFLVFHFLVFGSGHPSAKAQPSTDAAAVVAGDAPAAVVPDPLTTANGANGSHGAVVAAPSAAVVPAAPGVPAGARGPAAAVVPSKAMPAFDGTGNAL